MDRTRKGATLGSGPAVLSGAAAGVAYASFIIDPIACGKRLHASHGRVFAVDPPLSKKDKGRRAIFIADEALIEHVLDHPEAYRTVGVAVTRGPPDSAQRRLRNGVVRMNGPDQAALRRAYAPSLARTRLCKRADEVSRICAEEVASWPLDQPFDAALRVKRLVRRAAASLLFGASEDPRALSLADMMDRHSQLQYSRRTFLLPLDIPGAPYRALLAHAEETERALIAWIAAHGTDGDDLLACIACMRDAAGAPLDARAQAAQLWTLYGASFETTAATLTWALLHLMWNPNAARQLWKHVVDRGEDAPYLDAFINETLRLTPPVAYQMRRATGACELGGLRLRQGDRILLSALVLNRDSALYEKADTFRPGRWDSITSTALRPLAFSGGPRRCLGYHFAVMVMKSALVAIVPRLRMEVVRTAHIGVRLAITQAPSNAPVVARPTTGEFSASRFTGSAARQMSVPAADVRRAAALEPVHAI